MVNLTAATDPASAETAEKITEPAANPSVFSLEGIYGLVENTLLSGWTAFIEHIPLLVAALVVLMLAWLISIGSRRLLDKALKRSHTRASLRLLSTRLLGIVIWIVGFMMAAVIVFPEVTPASLFGAMGVASLAIGFAFKDIFENFFAGILLLWKFPFENGDFIECEGIEGQVEDITIRMTQIRKVSGELVVVPNSMLFTNPVDVVTNRPKRRITIMAGIAYDESLEEAIPLIEDTLKKCETVADAYPVQIFANGFGASSMDIEVTWWADPKPVDVRRSRSEVVRAVKLALDNAGIEIPFPYRTLTFKEPLPTRVVSDDE